MAMFEFEGRRDISLFVKYVWFILFFFFIQLMISSFGIIAES